MPSATLADSQFVVDEQMGKIGQWLQVSANIGILCGLILVGVQINQATGIVAAQFSTQNYESTMQSFDVVVGKELVDAWSKAMVNSPDLSDAELVVIDAYLMREWLNNTKNQVQVELGYGPGNTDLSLKKWTNQYLVEHRRGTRETGQSPTEVSHDLS